MLALPSVEVMKLVDAESCNSWTEAGLRSPTVSVSRLSVPGKASGEYQKACGAFKDKRYTDAEGHVRKALSAYEDYAAAWVLLGQILDAQHKPDEARDACEKASKADPNYSPPYVCQAEFAARAKDWDALSKSAKRALELDPANNMYAYYYSAMAALHYKVLPEAELDGQSAVKLDAQHRLPQVHLLLAKVYEEKGNRDAEAAELREYLKRNPKAAESEAVRSALTQLEARHNY
jgi:predicted Zn-dependent protease